MCACNRNASRSPPSLGQGPCPLEEQLASAGHTPSFAYKSRGPQKGGKQIKASPIFKTPVSLSSHWRCQLHHGAHRNDCEDPYLGECFGVTHHDTRPYEYASFMRRDSQQPTSRRMMLREPAVVVLSRGLNVSVINC